MVSTHSNTKHPPAVCAYFEHRVHSAFVFHNVTTKFKFTNRLKLNSPTKRIDFKENMNTDSTFPYFILSNGNVPSCKKFLHNHLHMIYLLLVVYSHLCFSTLTCFRNLLASHLTLFSFPPLKEDVKHLKEQG